MASGFQPTADADLLPQHERTFAELIADIRTRVFAGVNDAAQDDDLRLFILGRKILNHTDPEIMAEMVGWGLPAESVVQLLISIEECGSSDLGDPVERLPMAGTAEFVTTNAAAAAVRRVADRNARRYRLAARMVADQPRQIREDLVFNPRPPSNRPKPGGRLRQILLWTAVVAAVVTTVCVGVGYLLKR